MRLYVDLNKSEQKPPGATPPGVGASGASAAPAAPKAPTGGASVPAVPKTPGAAVAGSGPQTVACPLGMNCPDGGQHQMGSARLQEHTELAQHAAQSGHMPGDESTGKDTGNPGVPPGSTNLGSVGSDQAVQRTPPPVAMAAMPAEAPTKRKKSKKAKDESAPADTQQVGQATYGQKLGNEGHKQFETGKSPIVGHDENATDNAQTLKEFPAHTQEDVGNEGPGSQKQTLNDATMNADPDKKRQDVPNPMVPNEAAVPHDSKPMDHYRLAQVARNSDDEELAKFHEGMARKRTDGMGSEDHKDLANDLHKEGMHDQAKYHEGIHDRVTGKTAGSQSPAKGKIGPNGERFDLERGTPEYEKETEQRKGEHYGVYQRRLEKEHGRTIMPSALQPGNNGSFYPDRIAAYEARKARVSRNFEAARKEHNTPVPETTENPAHETAMRDTHHEARTKAEDDLKNAKDEHAKLQVKAEELKTRNKTALDKHEADKAEHAKLKAQGKKRAAPKKPKLEEEPEVPDRPALSEPETDHEKLQHETHTARAQGVADMAESHLKGNKTLSAGERTRLERAHQMAVHHANIGYTPTAAHKKELGDVERAVSGMGIKENYADVQAKEDAQVTGAAAAAADKDRVTQEKQQQKQDKVAGKEQAAQQKQEAKDQASQPKPPVTDLDHARVADHQGKAKKLRESLESHMAQNPNMSEEEHAKAESVLKELEKHEQMDMVPGGEHNAELKELQKISGDLGKKQYEPEKDGEGGSGGGASSVDTGGNYAFNMLHQGRALSHGLAASATSPHGAAGQAGSQVINYGVSGATHAGHRLLHASEQNEREAQRAPVAPKGSE